MATTTPPPTVDDDVLYEVIDGRIVEKPPMGSFSTWLAGVLHEHLAPYARTHRLGKVVTEMLFRIDPAKNLQRRPDVAFVGHARWAFTSRVPDEAFWDVVPDLAIEVVSPSNSAGAVKKKIHEYFRAGVARVWVVYPETLEVEDYESPTSVRILQVGDELDAAPQLPGLRLPLSTLFQEEAE